MSAPFIIDLRCLQHPETATRGIGNHAASIATHCPAPFIALIDPSLPPLPTHIAQLPASITPHAYIPHLAPGTVFLNPSPMGPDPLFIARLLTHPNLTKAACVHDFIPYDEPETYLHATAARLAYTNALVWLRRYNVFFPVSEHTNTRLQSLLGPVRSHVTGAALPAWLTDTIPEPPRHILMVGGADARKNPEILLRAHAQSPALRDFPLVITGPSLAGANKTVHFPGRPTRSGLRTLYAQALCVVAPSRAEGFSLPVIEAMAAHTPAIVSDIPAHRALVPDPAARFAPDDTPALTAILEDVLVRPARRAELIATQSDGWRPFTGAAISAKIWSQLLPTTPYVARVARPRIAMLTPMPPAKTGIADYSAALAPELSRLADVDILTPPNLTARPHVSGKYDAVLSIIGNSAHHREIYDHAIRYGAAVICHDSRLAGLATSRGLAHAAAIASRELRRSVTEPEVQSWTEDETIREASFLGDLASSARPLIFHAKPSVEEVSRRFGITARHLPFAMQRVFPDVSPAARSRARAALQLPTAPFIIASFGFIGPHKAIPIALQALAHLRERLNAILVFVGEPTPATPGYKSLARALGISGFVQFGTGYLSESAYRNYLLAADCALQLREGPPGNISGALQDCIAAGLPTVASTDLAANTNAPSYVHSVPNTPGVIAHMLEHCLQPTDTSAERLSCCASQSMSRYASALIEILTEKPQQEHAFLQHDGAVQSQLAPADKNRQQTKNFAELF